MKSPVGNEFGWKFLDQVDSTQHLASQALAHGERVGAIVASHQTAGRGRFGRVWFSRPGESLAMSLILRDYADHPKPYLIGMSVGLAVAGAVHVQVRWPNDVVIGNRKVGGVLTELIRDPQGRNVPIVGIGVNLNQESFPDEIAETAISLHQAHGATYDPQEVAKAIVRRIELLPEPESWQSIQTVWELFDKTAGKRYRIPSGEEGIAVGVGSDGQLICSVHGESQSVLAAEALFGPAA